MLQNVSTIEHRKEKKGTSRQRSGKGAIRKNSHSKNRDGETLN